MQELLRLCKDCLRDLETMKNTLAILELCEHCAPLSSRGIGSFVYDPFLPDCARWALFLEQSFVYSRSGHVSAARVGKHCMHINLYVQENSCTHETLPSCGCRPRFKLRNRNNHSVLHRSRPVYSDHLVQSLCLWDDVFRFIPSPCSTCAVIIMFKSSWRWLQLLF